MKAPFFLLALVAALLIACLGSPFASSLPDGLDHFAEKEGVEAARPVFPAPLADYAAPVSRYGAVQTAAAGGVGTLLTFAALFLGGRTVARSRSMPE